MAVGVVARGHRPQLPCLTSGDQRVAHDAGAVAAAAQAVGERGVHDRHALRREVLLGVGDVVVELDAHQVQLRLGRHLVCDLRDSGAVVGVAVEALSAEALRCHGQRKMPGRLFGGEALEAQVDDRQLHTRSVEAGALPRRRTRLRHALRRDRRSRSPGLVDAAHAPVVGQWRELVGRDPGEQRTVRRRAHGPPDTLDGRPQISRVVTADAHDDRR